MTSEAAVGRREWSEIRPSWTPIYGNCNERFFFSADAFVRCMGIAGHAGLHRCHYDTGPQKAMFIWGDEKRQTDLSSLVNTDPLALSAVSDA